MFSVCVCAFFCVCEQVEALRRTDHRPSSPTECLRSSKLKWNGEFHGGRPRPTGAVVTMKKKLGIYAVWLMSSNISEKSTVLPSG
jgi:hypothetical protein